MSKQLSTDLLDTHLIQMDKVVAEYLKGNSPREIATMLQMPPSKVGTLLKEWRMLASNNEAIRTRAVVALRDADLHYNKLVKKLYDLLGDAENAGNLTQRLQTLKTIADLEKVRIDMLQKAGAIEDRDIGDQIVETERKQKILMDILKDVVGPCSRCRPLVHDRLREATKEVIVINAEPE